MIYLQSAQRLWSIVFFLFHHGLHTGLTPHCHGPRMTTWSQTRVNVYRMEKNDDYNKKKEI